MNLAGLWQHYFAFTLTRYVKHNRYSSLILLGFLMFNFFILAFTRGTINELAFILFGAPTIYACLVYNMRVGTGVALMALGGKILDLLFLSSTKMAGFQLLQDIFIPSFYLFFCLLIGRLIINERDSRERYRRLSEKLAWANEANTMSFVSTIQALATAIDAKDAYTKGHSERVTGYSLEIAKALGLPKVQQQNILYGAILHDVGKIGVPSDVLRKAAPLDDEEFAAVKEHPARGADILGSIEALGEVIPMVYYHHEWYNGEGYPEGIAGAKIPIGARIIAVADAYDAMTSDRPYRRGRSEAEAIQELQRCRGTQFDPYVVDAFIKILFEDKCYSPECISLLYKEAIPQL